MAGWKKILTESPLEDDLASGSPSGAGQVLTSAGTGSSVPVWSNVATSFNDLSDTNMTTPAEHSMLLHDSNGKWIDNVISGDATLTSDGELLIVPKRITIQDLVDISTGTAFNPRFLGRNSNGQGDIEELTPAVAFEMFNSDLEGDFQMGDQPDDTFILGGDIKIGAATGAGASTVTLGKAQTGQLAVEAQSGDNVAGTDIQITAGQGTGTGAGGEIIFQVAAAGLTGSSVNALATAMTIAEDKTVTFAGSIDVNGSLSTINTQNLEVSDQVIILHTGATAGTYAGSKADCAISFVGTNTSPVLTEVGKLVWDYTGGMTYAAGNTDIGLFKIGTTDAVSSFANQNSTDIATQMPALFSGGARLDATSGTAYKAVGSPGENHDGMIIWNGTDLYVYDS